MTHDRRALRPSPAVLNVAILPGLLLLLNILIVGRLFSVEYSAYLESNEGTFIAIARQIAEHPLDLKWWPQWDCGLPFQNTYLPLLHLIVGAFSRLTGHSPALSFHQVSAAFFCLGPLAVYLMAWRMTLQPITSFLAALTFSLFTPCAFLVEMIRNDLGSPWNPRRLQIIGYYGEGPYTASIAFLPLAILFLSLSLRRNELWVKVLAGIFVGATILANAFGGVVLVLVCLCLVTTVHTQNAWRNFWLLAAIGVVAYLWISPLAPPTVLAAIKMNSPTVDGDYRFTARSWMGAAILAVCFASLWRITKHLRAPELRFFLHFALLTSGIVLLGTRARMNLVPQPHRYQIVMDMALCLSAIFAASYLIQRYAPRLARPAGLLLCLALLFQFRHDLHYARGLIRSADITQTPPYRIAKWVEANMPGHRVMISGSYSFHFNDFTDTPQVHGGHDPMLPNFMLRIATFFLYSGMNAGTRDAQVSVTWLKALGANAISVPGPRSREYYKPFANPHKFENVLPVLWHEDDDTIYSVPQRTASLAHVIPKDALVAKPPENGLDVAQLEKYVQALDDPTLPSASFEWQSRHSARINLTAAPAQAVSIQVTYHPGWQATINGVPQTLREDGLGFLALEPACNGPCEILLEYDGGPEWRATCMASLLVSATVLYRLRQTLRGLSPIAAGRQDVDRNRL